jgi:hypothetical protein
MSAFIPTVRASLERLIDLSKRHATTSAWDGAFFHARAALAELEREGPTDQQLLNMRSWSSYGPTPDSDLVAFGRRCYDLGRQRATPPAPEQGEVAELVRWIHKEAIHGPDTDEWRRAATLLQQQEAELAALRGVPVAWCRSDEFAKSMNRGGSFSGWKDPGAGTNKCDMQLYAIPLPAPQAGEVES